MKTFDMNNAELSTEVTKEDLAEAIKDKFGVIYSKDRKRLLIGLQGYLGHNIEYYIPEGTNIICDMAFAGCKGLCSIHIPDSVTAIGMCAFYGNKSLVNIHIPSSVTKIGYGAFAKCTNMSSITVSQDNPYFDSRENCNAVICTKTGVDILIAGCKETHIPNSVKKIGNRAFWGCSNLTDIHIPDSVMEIEEWAFSWCWRLVSIHIPDSVTKIGTGAFNGCNKLINIYFPNSVTQIGHVVFSWYHKINIHIPYKTKDKFAKLLPNHKSFLVEISENGFILENKSNWQEFKRLLDEYKIEKLYHFTDEKNIESIIQHKGLYSWSDCESRGIKITKSGGNQQSHKNDYWDGLQGFVRVCFTKEHPMMHDAIKDERNLKPVILEIDPKVVYLKTTLFADRNATRKGTNIGGKIEDFKKIHFNSIMNNKYFDLDEEEQPYFQAEVLVDGHIPLDYITIPSKL